MSDLAVELMLRTGARAAVRDVARVLAALAVGEPGVTAVEVRTTDGVLVSPAAPAYGATGSVEIPLVVVGEAPVGSVVLHLDRPGADVSALERLAPVAAVLLDAAGARDRLAREAADLRHDLGRDELTGLRSRAALHPRLGEPCVDGVLYLDLDRFKAVNDRHGHRVGDLLLASVARRVAAGVRASDEVYRVGGDEFVVCCRGADPDGLRALARRITGSVVAPHDLGGVRITVGVSIGAAAGPDLLGALIDRADRDMYIVKHSAVEAS